MESRSKQIRRVAASGLSALMLVLSVAVPVLERLDLSHQPVLESEHNPSTCPRAHDHTICTQLSASASAPAAAISYRQPHEVTHLSPTVEAHAPALRATARANPSRAPPSV